MRGGPGQCARGNPPARGVALPGRARAGSDGGEFYPGGRTTPGFRHRRGCLRWRAAGQHARNHLFPASSARVGCVPVEGRIGKAALAAGHRGARRRGVRLRRVPVGGRAKGGEPRLSDVWDGLRRGFRAGRTNPPGRGRQELRGGPSWLAAGRPSGLRETGAARRLMLRARDWACWRPGNFPNAGAKARRRARSWRAWPPKATPRRSKSFPSMRRPSAKWPALLTDTLGLDLVLLGSLAGYLGASWLEAVRESFRARVLPFLGEKCVIAAAGLGRRLQDCSALAAARAGVI